MTKPEHLASGGESAERPILFSGPMVRAILEGRKTQTRRVVKPQPRVAGAARDGDDFLGPPPRCPYGVPGDRLWVRETWGWNSIASMPPSPDYKQFLLYAAEPENALLKESFVGFNWRPSIHIPRWASRITLEITEVRVQRLQEISEEDAKTEGCEPRPSGTWWQGYSEVEGDLIHQQHCGDTPPDWMIEPHKMKPTPHLDRTAKDAYRALWDSINGKRPGCAWSDNPWVWAVSFKRPTESPVGKPSR